MAWAMLHRYRTAMVPGRERLGGTVEADETFLGGPEPGAGGRGALGKTMVTVAIERDGRVWTLPDAGELRRHRAVVAVLTCPWRSKTIPLHPW